MMVNILDAEQYPLRGKDSIAGELYDQAIGQAVKNKFINAEALGCELAADFHVAAGRRDEAGKYAERARVSYMKWGAGAKVKHVEKKFSGLLKKAE